MQQQDKRIQKEQLYQLFTIILIIIITSTAGIAQFILSPGKKNTEPLKSQIELFDETGINESEKLVLSTLYTEIVFSNWQHDQTLNTYYIYFINLKKYFLTDGVDLSKDQCKQVISKIKDMQTIFYLENESNLSKMSVDGRGIAIDLFEQIFDICGLKIYTNMEGEIEEIQDQIGNVMYQNKTSVIPDGFQVYAFISILIIMISLLIISIIIVKKNQLFRRDVSLDEFDEKRFA
jgi:hypothetical protein